MSQILDEMKAILAGHSIDESDSLMHYGMPRRSGRYPYGSGEDPYQHDNRDFLGRVEELRKQNFTYTDEKDGKTYTGDTAIAKSLGLSTTEFRTELGICKDERRMLQVARAKSLRDDGLNPTEIGRQMGVNESTVRSWFNQESENRMKAAQNTADFLKKRMEEVADKGGMLDVGKGAEIELNISKEKLDQALYLLKREGYEVYNNRVEQVTNRGKFTTQKVLCPPGTEHKEIYDLERIHTIKDYISRDGGDTYEKKFHYPASLNSKRLMIRSAEEGGLEKDGLIELRRGVKDLSLGESRYSQVRIMVDNSLYMKGMAVYSDDMPDGVDVIFNSNKPKDAPLSKHLKEIKPDPENPFGSLIKDANKGGQYWYEDEKTGEKKLGLINKRADESDWSDWKDALPAQFLSKQSLALARKQLDLAKADKIAEYEEICALTNPTIKKHFLKEFSDNCDAAAVNLKAAALPGQKYHVIIPVPSMKDDEIYAPRYKDGTKLALVRYPHGGTFEIPIVTVNNKNAEAKKLIGTDAGDAVCINSKVAEILSGADFDGDTVMCIPTHDKGGRVKIENQEPLEGLKGFDHKAKYGPDSYAGQNVKLMTKKKMQIEMGVITNLITDMTLVGAEPDEMAAAVRHSMVVIDAYKHKLNYKQSEMDNNVAALHKKYQGKTTGGSATIISRAGGPKPVTKRQGTPKINMKGKDWYDPTRPEGALIYKTADDAYYTKTTVNRKGEIVVKQKTKTQDSTKMAEVDDARELISDFKHPMEIIYADYANSMKSLANQARKEMMTTGKIEFSKEAKSIYQDEVNSLQNKLNEAEKNHLRERAALRKANIEVNAKKAADPNMDNSDIKKASQKAISKYREQYGTVARRDRSINITDREWEAIQAGAISENKLNKILANSDPDSLRDRATPRVRNTISPAQISRIKAYRSSNYTIAQIADKLNLSPSVVSKYMKGE